MRVHNSVTSVVLLVLAVACSGASSARRPSRIPAPTVTAALTHTVFFGSSSTAPATIEVRVTNNASEPVIVRRIEIDSAGMASWGLQRQSRPYREVVAPGETRPITFFATAVRVTSRPQEPLHFNVRTEFEAEGTRWQQYLRVMSGNSPY